MANSKLPVACTAESGTCAKCQSACTYKPGWFLPGEAEKVAEYLGMSMETLFAEWLGVDWWEGSDLPTFVLSPAMTTHPSGTEFPGDPRGACVFYKDGRCSIHPVKPFECRTYWCGMKDGHTYHRETAQAWGSNQAQIEQLLGRVPVSKPFEGGDLTLGMLLGVLFGETQ